LIDRLVGRHHQELGLIVILTVSKLIFIIYLYRLLLLRLGGREGRGVGGIRGGGGLEVNRKKEK